MRRHLRNPWVWIAAVVLLVLWLLWPRPLSSPPPPAAPAAIGQVPAKATPRPSADPDDAPDRSRPVTVPTRAFAS